MKTKTKKEIQEAINYLGFSKRNFLKLIKYRIKRFYSKLKNAYKRYMEETLTLTESNIDRYIRRMEKVLQENSKNKVNWSIESIYNFIKEK